MFTLLSILFSLSLFLLNKQPVLLNVKCELRSVEDVEDNSSGKVGSPYLIKISKYYWLRGVNGWEKLIFIVQHLQLMINIKYVLLWAAVTMFLVIWHCNKLADFHKKLKDVIKQILIVNWCFKENFHEKISTMFFYIFRPSLPFSFSCLYEDNQWRRSRKLRFTYSKTVFSFRNKKACWSLLINKRKELHNTSVTLYIQLNLFA